MNNYCTKQAFVSTHRHALYPPTSHHLCHTYLVRKCQSGGEVGQMDVRGGGCYQWATLWQAVVEVVVVG